jgi:sortase (surface protein transpeptidase)
LPAGPAAVLRNLSNLFFLASAIILIALGYQLWLRYQPSSAIQPYNHSAIEPASRLPTRITLSDIGLDLPVIPVEVLNNIWPETTEGVSYMSNSPLPGDPGNSIFWGHDFPRLLGNLKSATVGQTLSVYFGSVKKDFIISKKIITSPTDLSILSSTIYPQLTIYSCTGFLDSQRLALVASPKQ